MVINRRIILFVIFFILCLSSYSFSEEIDELEIADEFIDKQLNSLNIRELELVLEDIVRSNSNKLPDVDIKEVIISAIKGEKSIDIGEIIKIVFKSLISEVKDNLILISQILVITIACSVLSNLQSSFEQDTISKLAHYSCYIILSMMIINSFNMAFNLGKDTVIKMVNFMQIILPILLALLTAVGGPNARLLFHPVVIGTVNIIGTLIKNIMFPLIFFTFIVGIISNISQRVQFSKLSELMRETVVAIIGAAFTVFIGIITIYGIGAKIDGITIRTAKFAVDSFVPIIGKFLSDAVEAVVGGSAILKNGIGMVGLIALILLCLAPIIKIVILIFVYKLIAALTQPVVSDNILSFFNEVSKALVLVLVSILSVTTMFFITITVIVEAGNAALMFR